MTRLLMYFMAFPSLLILRWDFCPRFLGALLGIGLTYDLIHAGNWLLALAGKTVEWNIPFLHPGYYFSGSSYLPDRFELPRWQDLLNLEPRQAVVWYMTLGIALLFLNLVWARFRNSSLPTLSAGSIPLLFSGGSIFPFKLLFIKSRTHRLYLEPLLLLTISGVMYDQGQGALANLIFCNAIFYFIGSTADLSQYQDLYLKEKPKKIKTPQQTRLQKALDPQSSPLVIAAVCHPPKTSPRRSTGTIKPAIPVTLIPQGLSDDLKKLLNQ